MTAAHTHAFCAFGITSAFGAIVACLLTSLLLERSQLMEFWRRGDDN